MLMGRARCLPLAFCLLSVIAHAQEAKLESGKPVKREIAGGESHTYQISLAVGQFVRIVVEQKAIDVALVLAAPDGKQVVEINFTAAGGLESLSAEAAASGDYRLTVRASGSAALAGSYQVRPEVKAAATAQDRQRIAAERWMLEADELRKQAGKMAEQAIDKLQQALSVWRSLSDPYWTAWSLSRIGVANFDLSRHDKAIEHYEQALAIHREIKDRAGEGITLNGLGVAYSNLGRHDKAVEYYEQALAISREVKNRAGEGGAMISLGNASRNLGRSEEAIEYYEQAVVIHREVKDRAGEGRALNNLGIAYSSLGRYERA
ncbi:MAG TPA: tetratricopeptide repeat protein, partial [Blastocatellia bacterium]|nr:tetratricopeptide repeat protein [Blastocatellia bacterium]